LDDSINIKKSHINSLSNTNLSLPHEFLEGIQFSFDLANQVYFHLRRNLPFQIEARRPFPFSELFLCDDIVSLAFGSGVLSPVGVEGADNTDVPTRAGTSIAALRSDREDRLLEAIRVVLLENNCLRTSLIATLCNLSKLHWCCPGAFATCAGGSGSGSCISVQASCSETVITTGYGER
jgi:hypothetical protein